MLRVLVSNRELLRNLTNLQNLLVQDLIPEQSPDKIWELWQRIETSDFLVVGDLEGEDKTVSLAVGIALSRGIPVVSKADVPIFGGIVLEINSNSWDMAIESILGNREEISVMSSNES